MKKTLSRRVAIGAGLCAVLAVYVILARRTMPPAIQQPEARHASELVQKDGRWYRLGETNTFTGWMEDYYPGGALWSRCQISNGLLNGLSETWYTNGQMHVREQFKDGIASGQRQKWHENGKM